MPVIKIADKDYEFDSLNDTAKATVVSLQFVDQEIVRLQAQLAAMQTARVAYIRALQDALPKFEPDTIRFS